MILSISLLLEVADKEPALWYVWLLHLGIGTVGLVLGRSRPWGALLALGLILLAGIAQHAELADSYVGPSIRNELGYGYVVQSYLAISAGTILTLVGLMLGLRRRSEEATGAS